MTQQPSHTPGPWHVLARRIPRGPTPWVWEIYRQDKATGLSIEPTDANARLIAAAPALLEAAERALGYARVAMDSVSSAKPDWEFIRAAIQKAREAQS